MKTIRLIASAVFVWGLTPSCSDEINLFPENPPDKLYVLACLDASGSVQQVKVRKLIHGRGDARVIINQPENYLPDDSLQVMFETSSAGTYFLQPVDYPPQTGGPFSQDSNRIYELHDFRPVPGERVQLRIIDPSAGVTLTSSTGAIGAPSFNFPVPASVVHSTFSFTEPDKPFHIGYTPGPVTIWTISLKYVEYGFDGEMHCRKGTFSGATDLYRDTIREFSLPYLINIFNKVIPADPSVDFRMFYRFDFAIWIGDSRLKNYIGVASKFTDNRRFSADNISGGMGLFFAVNHAVLKNVCPKESLCWTLADSSVTRQLKFSRFLYDGPYTDPDSSLVNPFVNPMP
jgi:hypothetical protein